MERILWFGLAALLLGPAVRVLLGFASEAAPTRIRNNPHVLAALPANGIKDPPPPFFVLDPGDYRSYFPNDASFETAKRYAPFVDLPGNFSDALTAYYYRIRSYRKHIRKTDDDKYWVVTEFLPNVPWAGTSNTISAAAGHHILEGRWFFDAPVFVEDYIRFWYLGAGSTSSTSTRTVPEPHKAEKEPFQPQAQAQPHLATYTNWIYYSTWHYAQLWGLDGQRTSLLRDTFASAAHVFRTIYVDKYLTNSTRNAGHWNGSKRICWTQDDGYDAMEVSVSGGGCRPTIAAAMWGEARALVEVATLLKAKDRDGTQHQAGIDEFTNWASFTEKVLQQHWNPNIESFAVIPPPIQEEEEFWTNATDPKCDIHKIRTSDQPVDVRELLAFMPWYYSSLLNKQDHDISQFARQFQWLLESTGDNGFTAPWGLRTVQRNTPCYNYSWEHGDCWNGPSWPYETSRVLTAVANLLADFNSTVNGTGHASGSSNSGMTPQIWQHLFLQYARQHTATTAVNDTAHPLHSGHVFENLHPDLGYWNNRARMYWRNDSKVKDMGDDYNHSTFLDLVLGSWLGIRTPKSTGGPWLRLYPLIRSAPYFCADRIPYRGRLMSIVYDPSGKQYPKIAIAGLVVLLEGRIVAHRPDVGPIVLSEEPPREEQQREGQVRLDE